eukprot:scaffold36319_cov53-Phaeocystis_antarctica.AAC.6
MHAEEPRIANSAHLLHCRFPVALSSWDRAGIERSWDGAGKWDEAGNRLGELGLSSTYFNRYSVFGSPKKRI